MIHKSVSAVVFFILICMYNWPAVSAPFFKVKLNGLISIGALDGWLMFTQISTFPALSETFKNVFSNPITNSVFMGCHQDKCKWLLSHSHESLYSPSSSLITTVTLSGVRITPACGVVMDSTTLKCSGTSGIVSLRTGISTHCFLLLGPNVKSTVLLA